MRTKKKQRNKKTYYRVNKKKKTNNKRTNRKRINKRINNKRTTNKRINNKRIKKKTIRKLFGGMVDGDSVTVSEGDENFYSICKELFES